MAAQRSFLIRIAEESRASAIVEFQKKYLTEYLWPRTEKEFADLAAQECLYEAIEIADGTERLVGICYIKHGQEPDAPGVERAEFGGVFVLPDCRGCGLATAMGFVAISNHFAWDPPRGRLIAHVHEFNNDPRRILEEHLGFVRKGEEIPPPEIAPRSMKRNSKGQVVGHLFEFHRRALLRFADWIEKFPGTIEGKSGKSGLRVELPLITRNKDDAVKALRELAKS